MQAYEATRATDAQTYSLPIEKTSGHQRGDNNGRRANGWRHFEFVCPAREERQGDLTGGVAIIAEAGLAVLRIGRKPTVPGIFFALADIGLALFLTSVKTVRINDGVGTTAIRLCAMAGRELKTVVSWKQTDA